MRPCLSAQRDGKREDREGLRDGAREDREGRVRRV